MWNITKPPRVPQSISDDVELHLIAQQALAPMHFPFDGLHIGAALALHQLGLADNPSGLPDKAQALSESRKP